MDLIKLTCQQQHFDHTVIDRIKRLSFDRTFCAPATRTTKISSSQPGKQGFIVKICASNVLVTTEQINITDCISMDFPLDLIQNFSEGRRGNLDYKIHGPPGWNTVSRVESNTYRKLDG